MEGAVSDEILVGERTEVSYQLPMTLEYARWLEIGHVLSGIEKATPLWSADWLEHGVNLYGERAYAEVEAVTGLSEEQLRIRKWVASRIPPNRRRREVRSFAVYRELCPLEQAQQDAWLDKVEAEQLSVRALRKALRDAGLSKAKPRTDRLVKLQAAIRSLTDAERIELKTWLDAYEENANGEAIDVA